MWDTMLVDVVGIEKVIEWLWTRKTKKSFQALGFPVIGLGGRGTKVECVVVFAD